MKKSTILGLIALALTFSLGIGTPTFATGSTAVPTYNDINRALSSVKSMAGYYEYATLIQDINASNFYRLADDLLAIDNSLTLTNKTNSELINIAKSLPNYEIYAYLYNLVDFTENWLPSYNSANPSDQIEAFEAVNDAVVSCRYLIKETTSRDASTVQAPTAQSTSTTQQNVNVSTSPSVMTTPLAHTEQQAVASRESTDTTPETRTENTSTVGTTISVTVLPPEDSTVENSTEQDLAQENHTTSTDEESTNNPMATNIAYAATATSLAGVALATKREITNKTRRF